MKQSLPVIFCLCMCFFSSGGQKLQWSAAQKITDRAYITESLGSNSGGLFLTKKNNRGQEHNIIVERYMDDLHRSVSKVFLTHHNEYFIRMFLDSNNLKMIYAVPQKDKKNLDICLKTINFNLTESGKDTVLFSIEALSPEKAMVTVYKMKLSPYILITYTNDRGDFATNYEYIQFDSEYNRINSGSFSTGNLKKAAIEQVSFNYGSIAFLVREDVKEKMMKQGYRFYIFDGTIGGTEWRTTELFSDSVNITEGVLKTDFKNHKMIFGGLYATRDSSYVKGYYIWKLDLRSNTLISVYTRFSPDVIAQMAGKRNKLQGIFNLRAGDMALRSDGGIVLTTEEYQETQENVTDVNAYGVAQSNVRNYYYYQNLLVLSINPLCSEDWHAVIRKDQVTVNDNGTFSSYLVSVMPEHIVYVYNDLSRKNWNLSYTEINDQGVVTNGILVKPKDYDGRMVPQYGDQVAYNQFILPEITPRGIVLLKVSY